MPKLDNNDEQLVADFFCLFSEHLNKALDEGTAVPSPEQYAETLPQHLQKAMKEAARMSMLMKGVAPPESWK